MIIHDLYIVGITLLPAKADPPLLVDPDRMLPLAVSREGLQAIARRHTQVIQARCSVQQRQLPARLPLEGPETPDILVMEEAFGVSIGNAPDHIPMLIETRHSVKRNTM
jgi:hypothetical protein